ncbi:MAG: Molybdopterin oxidoreductase, Psr/Psh family, PsrC-like rane anchor subunit [Ignavibacteria bacterium]|nr:Molybdopterin oxidoreductase, Psr/Psh family, PsrC-like rane anchor subunit [Ignavibacteria bacterium]
MHELLNSRHNLQIDPQLHIWGWEIAVYLFLGGLVAGIMIISGYFIFKGRAKNTGCSCHNTPFIALIAITLGMLALFLDLEHKLYFWRVYLSFKVTSPMSWGSWILLLVYPILVFNTLIKLPHWLSKIFPILKKLSEKINNNLSLIKFAGLFSMVIGTALGMYTGILLSTLSARPLWNSSMLWFLFLVSGLSSAAALIHMIAKDTEERVMLAKTDNFLLFSELIIIFLFIIGLITSTQVHIDAAKLFLGGDYTVAFWVFVVFGGIVIPLIIQSAAVRGRIHHTPIAPIMVIVGGLILRFVIVYAGQASHWTTKVLK